MTDAAPRHVRLYVAFDDTDTIDADRGTGKVGRWFEDELPDGCRLWAVVRQQLLVHPDVPFTSHNSAAVCVVDVVDPALTARVAVAGDGPLPGAVRPRASCSACSRSAPSGTSRRNWMDGSDPGLCVAWDGCRAMPALVAFGKRAAVEVVTQEEARAAAAGAHLSGHGGTEDGIIGAAAGVGLTADGWNGRLIEYRSVFGHLRDVPEPVVGRRPRRGRHHGRLHRPRRAGAAARRPGARRRLAAPAPVGRAAGAAGSA